LHALPRRLPLLPLLLFFLRQRRSVALCFRTQSLAPSGPSCRRCLLCLPSRYRYASRQVAGYRRLVAAQLRDLLWQPASNLLLDTCILGKLPLYVCVVHSMSAHQLQGTIKVTIDGEDASHRGKVWGGN
jgi:hypothetical protein